MYHDELWRRWLGHAAGLLPAQALQARHAHDGIAIEALGSQRDDGAEFLHIWAWLAADARAVQARGEGVIIKARGCRAYP